MVDAGIRRPDASEVLQPARELIEEEAFWRHRVRGLALFLRAGWSRWHRLEEVLTAAEAGRIGVLCSYRAHVVSASRIGVETSHGDEAQELGGRDPIEQAVVRTLLNGGAVYAIPEDEMPGRAPVAALFRY